LRATKAVPTIEIQVDELHIFVSKHLQHFLTPKSGGSSIIYESLKSVFYYLTSEKPKSMRPIFQESNPIILLLYVAVDNAFAVES
jgi:hypothetical protein